jgi:hypothetical protein
MHARQEARRVVGMTRRLAALPQYWLARIDRVDYLIRHAVTAYWLAPAPQRRAASASSNAPSRALLLRPLV